MAARSHKSLPGAVRNVALAILAGIRREPLSQTEAWLDRQDARQRAMWTAARVAALFAAALMSAWLGGPIGLGIYFVAVFFLVR